MLRNCVKTLLGLNYKTATQRLISSSSVSSAVKIYTKTGDKGKSSTFTGERRFKDDLIFDALGSTDELSSAIGFAAELCKEKGHTMDNRFQTPGIEFVDGNIAATGQGSTQKLPHSHCTFSSGVLPNFGKNISVPQVEKERTCFNDQHVKDLETWIDEYTAELPPLKNFILPSGGKTAASLHMARSICRRAERTVAPLVRDNEMDPSALQYLNRLSDFLFTVARYTCMKEGGEETIYKRPVS
ncbi:corrinoid adenosyltransferase MMAB [Octopus bimaculoides]|nr:corrinoid adenosyltransferase MMAB [Octopus bimaculoides]|eukprot:XP_014776611.1 PREDICTED: cob(I)yrinic acid a,c-diamide adenosyltransferase, mitochondrial-like [Octopus bimaculoides]